MKIYKGSYRNHWISPYTIIEYAFFWTDWSKCGRNTGVIAESDWIDHPRWVDKLATVISPISVGIKKVLDTVHPQINIVKIDRWDSWSADHTLSDIILPILKQLKYTKHGAPYTDDDDVPEYLQSKNAQPKEYEWDTDSLHFMRWDWILDEMIWAFGQKVDDTAEDKFFDHSSSNDKNPWDKEYVGPGYDKEGHQAWQERKSNGFRLFGKYYENLWD